MQGQFSAPKAGETCFIMAYDYQQDPREGIDACEPSLVTLIKVRPGQTLEKSSFEVYITTSLQNDDVFRVQFLTNIAFYGANKEDVHFGAGVDHLFDLWRTKRVDFIHTFDSSIESFPPGPYVGLGHHLWQAWRCYGDTNNAFMVSFEPVSVAAGE